MSLASTAAENAAVNAVLALISHLGLHTGTTGTTGTNEYAGVTRQAATWASASGGSGSNSGALAWTTDGLTAVTHIGGWSASTAGSFEQGFPLGSSVTAVNITAAVGAVALGAA